MEQKVDWFEDPLVGLADNLPLKDRLVKIHETLLEQVDFIDRISVILYDEDTDTVKTFIDSSGYDHPLDHYEVPLSEAPALQKIRETKQARVVNDLEVYQNSKHLHTKLIREHGYHSSFTLPMFLHSHFAGFVFFNSSETNRFSKKNLVPLTFATHLITATILEELTAFRTLLASLKTATDMVHVKDPETAGHLERMSRFARLIARDLAQSKKYAFDDEFIEKVFRFAPMHDIGKIGIPDHVLFKPGKLNHDEQEIMRSHTLKGKEIIDTIIQNFGFEHFGNIDILRHIAAHHHEALDGSGYPEGLKDGEIPIEARITSVADIFDALTSVRPYKVAWDNEEAFRFLERMAKDKLDGDCVEALVRNKKEVEAIQQRFSAKNDDES